MSGNYVGAEIQALAAETLALQAVIIHVLSRLADKGLRPIIEEGLSDAAAFLAGTSSDHRGKSLHIVEQIRQGVMRDDPLPLLRETPR